MRKFLRDSYLAFFNYIIPLILFMRIRIFFMKIMGMKLAKGVTVLRHLYVYAPNKIFISKNTVINQYVVLDGRGGLYIGENTNISPHVKIYTADHDVNDSKFSYRENKVVIGDNVWISTGSIVLPGVNIGDGAVIAAGSVVTKDVEPFSINGGVPAKIIGVRSRELDYNPAFIKWWH